MPRPTNTEARQAQIMDALARLLPTRGYAGASVSAIAREAGLSPGLVHYHFNSKQAILIALVERLGSLLDDRYARRIAHTHNPWARLRAFIDAHLALGSDADPVAARLWITISAEALHQPEVRVAYHQLIERAFERLHGLLEPLLEEAGRNEARTRKEVAAAIFSAIQGAYLLSATAPARTPPGFAAPSLAIMARGLITGEVEP